MQHDQPGLLIQVTRDGMGHADESLRHTLAANYFRMLHEHDMLPGAVAMYGDGVRLAVDGSPVLTSLQALEGRGVRILLCKTCLEHHGLTDRVAVGVVGGMHDILAAQWAADKVVAL
jgi:intracellular sulfur oxidation DsrE/DsrF family protein